MIRKVVTHLCVGTILLVLAGCGGGDSSAGTGGSGGSGGGHTSGTPQVYVAGVNPNFDKQLVGTTNSSRSIVIQSVGTAPLIISAISVAGPFSLGGNCIGTFPPGTECTINLSFSPTVPGYVSNVVTVESNLSFAPALSVSGLGYEDAGWVFGQFAPSANYAGRCAAPRTGTDPFTLAAYPDVQGKGVDERNWLRSWSKELYLWYDVLPDQDPGTFSSNEVYFDTLKWTGKDKFHFTYKTSDWESLAQSGVSAGYGATFLVLSATPPRNVVVAYTEPGSPAAAAPASLRRGAKVLSVDDVDINSNGQADALNAGLFPAAIGETHKFLVVDAGASSARTITLTSANVTSVPVQNVGLISTATGTVGYMLFNDHLATSEAGLVGAFSGFQSAGVSDLVLDIRYNGGGYLDIASEVAYMIAGPARTSGRTFELAQFNNKYPTVNPVTHQTLVPVPFHSTTQGFSLAPGQILPALNLSRVFVLTGPDTCSASEAIMNSLQGVDVQVIQIGSTTCGKPYGFYPQDNCGVTYFSIQFQGVNAKGFGDYGNGFTPANSASSVPVHVPGCSVGDDLAHELGDQSESRLAAALGYRASATCPVASGLAPKKALSATGEGYMPPTGDGRVMKSLWQQNRIVVRPLATP